jgi:hypothetical protein
MILGDISISIQAQVYIWPQNQNGNITEKNHLFHGKKKEFLVIKC